MTMPTAIRAVPDRQGGVEITLRLDREQWLVYQLLGLGDGVRTAPVSKPKPKARKPVARKKRSTWTPAAKRKLRATLAAKKQARQAITTPNGTSDAPERELAAATV